MKYLANVDCVYGPYTDAESGRQTVTVHKKDGSKRFVSYPKFLVEVVLGRALDLKQETVDHIDQDFTNNNWTNLRLVDRITHLTEDSRRVQLLYVVCVWCNKDFYRRPKEINRRGRKRESGPFCSRRCSGKHSAAKLHCQLPKESSWYNQWNKYEDAKTIYYTLDKGGETIADMAERLGRELPTEEEILAALPRRKVLAREPKPQVPCAICRRSTENKKYCSAECSSKGARKTKRPSKEKLYHLVWKYPTSYIAERLGVSDVAVAKWCRQYGIDKPPRGYWTKQKSKNGSA